MGSLFVRVYDFFAKRRVVLWLLLATLVALMGVLSFRVRYVEDINSFFPRQEHDISLIFENLDAKDKIAVMFTPSDEDPYSAMDAVDEFAEVLAENTDFTANAKFASGVDDRMLESMSDFVYGHLPLFMNDEAYEKLDSLTSSEAVEAKMKSNYDNLLSPMGGFVGDYIFKDPLSLGGDALKTFQQLGAAFSYKIIDGYIFSEDGMTLLSYITPRGDIERRDNEMVDAIEESLERVAKAHPEVDIVYFGAPAVANYNARQIKRDSIVTLSIALLIIVVFISLAFKNRYTICMVLTPAIFGALFSLALISMISGTISLIAVGAGSIIFGIALSYSIHMLAHTNHCSDVRQMIRELAYPLTVGSFTTIGAFVGLVFTNSMLLRDFGLFSSLTLVGATLFSLVFLPHIVSLTQGSQSESRLLAAIHKLSNFHLDRNRVLMVVIVLMAIGCSIFAGRVGFDSDMMNLNFMPEHLSRGESRLNEMIQSDEDGLSNTMFIASSSDPDEAVESYLLLCKELDVSLDQGTIGSYSSISNFIIPSEVQAERLKSWNEYWSEDRVTSLKESIEDNAENLGFESGAFNPFFDQILSHEYDLMSYDSKSDIVQIFPDWFSTSDELTLFIAQVNLPIESKSEIYEEFSKLDGVIAADRSFFAGKMAEDVNHNFNLILYISGVLIFMALLFSYGRFELALLSFMPMAVSWVMILGIMYLFGIEFNIVSIILSTFIFGIGDDFSIFMMDGLLNQYKDRSEVLSHHRVAIFFSAFTVIVGMGVLIFAKHPAMYSLGLISLIGILVVVLVTYTLLPFLFNFFIARPTGKGGFPWTIVSLVRSIHTYSLFVGGCLGIQGLILLLSLIPMRHRNRKYLVHCLVCGFSKLFLKLVPAVKFKKRNQQFAKLELPSVIIANHQSFVDIMILLSLQPKLVMVTNGWVWNSPFFGRIVRYLDFFHTQEGYEKLASSLQERIDDGYSVVIFPEGTRSNDSSIGRFHKGAFYLAEILKLDVLPVMMYGNSLVASKSQGLYIKPGVVMIEFLLRIAHSDSCFGEGYKERTKIISRHFKREYHRLYEECNRASNPYFRDAIIKNYIYKDPVLEWYMRVKLSMERWYDRYDRIVPRQGVIVDLGCGYGAMSYMLSMLSSERQLVSVDYDEQKINVAKNAFLKSDKINFYASDIRTFDAPRADAFIISDVLHYLDRESQETVVKRCVERLNEGGVIVIRDGDSSVVEQHVETAKTEKWSTEIIKFNKTDGPLCFLSRDSLGAVAAQNGLSMEILERDSKTSNTLFLLKRE